MTTQSVAGEIPVFTRGDRLRKARERLGLDQGPFAELLGVSRGTVSNYEADKVEKAKPVVLRAWAMATGVPLSWLETGEGAATPPPVPPGPSGPTPDDPEKRRRLDELAASKRRHADVPDTQRYLPAA